MPKVILLCGKICSGKSTYAQKLRLQEKAVLLSCDEITLALFGQNTQGDHDAFVERTQAYLFEKSLEVLETGISVILDWGFWTRSERDFAKAYYQGRNYNCELHFVEVSPVAQKMNLEKRNEAVRRQNVQAYEIIPEVVEGFNALFEFPQKEEVDVWIQNRENAQDAAEKE